jgi:hypothetical protein
VGISANLDQPNETLSGSCTFSTVSGQPSVTVTLLGVDVCKYPTSPPSTACGGTNYTISVALLPSDNVQYGRVDSVPAGVSCKMADAVTANSCSGTYPSGKQVVLTAANLHNSADVNYQWGGDCASAGTAQSAVVLATANLSCTLKFEP